MNIVLIVLIAVAVAAVVFVLLKTMRSRKEDNKPQVNNEPEKPAEKPKEEPVSEQTETVNEDVQEPVYNGAFEKYLKAFSGVVDIERDSKNYNYLYELYGEACTQSWHRPSDNGLPMLLKVENFPSLQAYGNMEDFLSAFETLVGYLFAMHIAELMPKSRTSLGGLGYELGRYNKYSNIYGYKFESDPNNMRLMAGVIYAAMRGVLKPDIEAMRKEVGGTKYSKTLAELADGTRTEVGVDDFFTDLREYMPTAPGPYAPGYTIRPDRTYPNEERDEYDNLMADRDIHEELVNTCNLNDQEAVQAIADKEGEKEHLFGEARKTEHYHFHPVFGKEVLGVTIDPESTLGRFATDVFNASNSARGILQASNVTPVQYGRLRPGCSWSQEACKNSSTDDRRNVLTNFEIEDGDGCPTGYYNENGDWVYMDGIHNPEEYEEKQKNSLFANSYPSGHSAGIMGVALLLIELFPKRSDLILRAAINFSLSRAKARYHWNSDIINGRVLGVWQNAVSHASSDYDDMLAKIRKELGL